MEGFLSNKKVDSRASFDDHLGSACKESKAAPMDAKSCRTVNTHAKIGFETRGSWSEAAVGRQGCILRLDDCAGRRSSPTLSSPGPSSGGSAKSSKVGYVCRAGNGLVEPRLEDELVREGLYITAWNRTFTRAT